MDTRSSSCNIHPFIRSIHRVSSAPNSLGYSPVRNASGPKIGRARTSLLVTYTSLNLPLLDT